MNDESKYNGYWWLPSSPNRKIPGTLTYNDQKGHFLELHGNFIDVPFPTINSWDIILGCTSNGKLITLHKNLLSNLKFSIPGYTILNIFTHNVFEGFHFNRIDDIKFNNAVIGFNHIDEWLNINAFEINNESRTTSIKYTLPEPLPFQIDDNFNIKIIFDQSGPTTSIVQKEVTIKQNAKIFIEFKEQKSFDDMLDIVYHINNFLTLAIKTIVNISSLSIKLEENSYINIFLQPPMFLNSSEEIIFPSKMLFTFNNVRDNFSLIIKRWFSKRNIIQPVHDLYFSTIYNKKMYGEHKFLSLAQAIESYHRRTCDGVYQDKSEYLKTIYQELIKSIPNDIDADYKVSIKNKMQYMNEFSLRKRLKDLFFKHNNVFSIYIENQKQFIDDVVNTRNYLTHYDESLLELAKTGHELYLLSDKLKFIIEVLLLRELEIEEEKIKIILAQNNQYDYLKNN